jgi:hypothetical protein
MAPEDELEIYFEVADNDAIAGPKVARTGTVALRLPSMEEVLQQAEQPQPISPRAQRARLPEATHHAPYPMSSRPRSSPGTSAAGG